MKLCPFKFNLENKGCEKEKCSLYMVHPKSESNHCAIFFIAICFSYFADHGFPMREGG